MTTKLIVDLASSSESPGCSSIFVHVQVTSESPGIASSSSWHIQRENTLLQHTLQHKHTTSRQRLSYCVSTMAARLGIPGSAYRVYWHSCLIACSIVHSVRANPQSLSLFVSLSLCMSLCLSLTLQGIRLIIPTHTPLWYTARQCIKQAQAHREAHKVITEQRQYLKDSLFQYPYFCEYYYNWFVSMSADHDANLSFDNSNANVWYHFLN